MKLILVSGKANSGKDHVSNKLSEYITKNFYTGYSNYKAKPIRMSLAEPVKQIARDVFGWNGEKDDKGRRLLINIGTWVGKDFGSKFIAGEDIIYLGCKEENISDIYKKFTRYFKPSVNLWSGILKDKILYTKEEKPVENIFVVSDNRFEDEIVYLQTIFGDDVIPIRVKENQRTKYIDDISETDLDKYDKFDFIIDNSIEENDKHLFKQFDKIFKGKL